MTNDPSPIVPVIPDWTVVTAPAARRAIEDILAAGHYESRVGGLDPAAARVLAQVLRLYVRLGRAPRLDEVAAAAELPVPGLRQYLTRLRERDLLLLDASGAAIRGAYPFTEAASAHSVSFRRTGHTLAAMCAIDALGAGAMCRDDITIRSACSACGASVIACTDDHGMTLKQVAPARAVVWVGLRESCGCAAETLCTELLFFCSDEHLVHRRSNRGDGHRLSPEEGFQVGKALFIDRAMAGRDPARGRVTAARGRTAPR